MSEERGRIGSTEPTRENFINNDQFNLDKIRELSPHFRFLMPRIDQIYDHAFRLIPTGTDEQTVTFARCLRLCHKGFLAAAVTIGRRHPDDAAAITRRAIETASLGLLPGNPMDAVEWRSAQRVENVDPFTVTELARIAAISAVDGDLLTLLDLWARTGLRAGEVMGLQPQDVDPVAGIILVRRAWTRQRLGPTKTGRERRVSFGHPIVEDTLEWRPQAGIVDSVAARIRKLKRAPLDPTGFLFTQPDGRPWSSSSLNTAWRRVLSSARVRYRPAEQLRLRSRRRSSQEGRRCFTSRLLAAGAVQACCSRSTRDGWIRDSGFQGNPPQPWRNLSW